MLMYLLLSALCNQTHDTDHHTNLHAMHNKLHHVNLKALMCSLGMHILNALSQYHQPPSSSQVILYSLHPHLLMNLIHCLTVLLTACASAALIIPPSPKI